MSTSQSPTPGIETVPETPRPLMPVGLFKAAIKGNIVLHTVPDQEHTENEVDDSQAFTIHIDRLSPISSDNVMQQSLSNKRERTEVIGLSSVLVITVSFAAAFTIPGGYKEDEGTPVLDRNYMFRAFIMANTLAFAFGFICLFEVFKIEVAGQPRAQAVRIAIDIFFLAANSLIVAFGLGLYLTLASDCLPTAISVLAITSLTGVRNMYSTSNNWKYLLTAYAVTFLLIFGLAKL